MCETKRIDIAQAKFIGSGVKKSELIEGVILNDIYILQYRHSMHGKIEESFFNAMDQCFSDH